jgi:radical SAM superfamily enzyme YgiQ (UPF0313 family)
MRVLLISVITENLYMTVLPLGAAYIAAAARDAGHDVKMLSLRSRNDDYLEILKTEVNRFRPRVIGVSMRNVDDQSMKNTVFLLEPVKEVVKTCRALSDATIVLGGAGYSIFPTSSLAYTGADMGIRGEGETAFALLLDRLENGKQPLDVPGLYLPEKGLQTQLYFPESLDGYTMPLPNIHLEIPGNSPDEPIWVPVQTRRGCPMDCSYCSTSAIEGRLLRKHSPERVVENIKKYVAAGIRHFFFVDNTFNFPASYAKALCDRIIAEKLDIQARCIVYPSKIDAELVQKMAKAGFREVSLGFESGSDVILKSFNKRFSLEEVRRISELFKKENVFQMGFLLLGGPGETRETVLESLEFVDALSLDLTKLSIGIRIYPNTPLAERAIQEGKISSRDDLLLPRFYVVEELKDWLYETVHQWAKDRPNWMV